MKFHCYLEISTSMVILTKARYLKIKEKSKGSCLHHHLGCLHHGVAPQPEANHGQGHVPGRIGASHHIADPDQEAITNATIALIIENIMIITTEGTFINIYLMTIVPCTTSLAASTVITSVISLKANISIFKNYLFFMSFCAFIMFIM